ncbi:MAG: hypothetical protein RL044_417 [Actinomycetota bacterium]|jgi:hypothetical protein
MTQPAEETAATPPTVVPGMGYPNNREETTPTPIGWQPVKDDNLTVVSRETFGARLEQ